MAEILVKTGTQISFAIHGTLSPTQENYEVGTPTDVEIALSGLADGAARQSAKFDFGATRAAQYVCHAVLEFQATPSAGQVVEFYLAPSPSATAGTANPGGISGTDSAYAGDATNLDDAVQQLQFIGVHICTALATTSVQAGVVTRVPFVALERYATLVVKNEGGAALVADNVEHHIVFTPVIDEAQ